MEDGYKPHDAVELRKLFQAEKEAVAAKDGTIIVTVNPETIGLSRPTSRHGIHLLVPLDGVSIEIPFDRRLIKRLKRELELAMTLEARLRSNRPVEHIAMLSNFDQREHGF